MPGRGFFVRRGGIYPSREACGDANGHGSSRTPTPTEAERLGPWRWERPRRGQDPSLRTGVNGRLVGSGLDRSGVLAETETYRAGNLFYVCASVNAQSPSGHRCARPPPLKGEAKGSPHRGAAREAGLRGSARLRHEKPHCFSAISTVVVGKANSQPSSRIKSKICRFSVFFTCMNSRRLTLVMYTRHARSML